MPVITPQTRQIAPLPAAAKDLPRSIVRPFGVDDAIAADRVSRLVEDEIRKLSTDRAIQSHREAAAIARLADRASRFVDAGLDERSHLDAAIASATMRSRDDSSEQAKVAAAIATADRLASERAHERRTIEQEIEGLARAMRRATGKAKETLRGRLRAARHKLATF